MFERFYFVIAPNFHGATLLSKLINDHPDVMSLGDTYPSNRFDQICGCGNHVSRCSFWTRVGERVGAERYRNFPQMLPAYPTILGARWDRLLYNTLPTWLLRKLIPKHRRLRFANDFEAFTKAVQEIGGRPGTSVYVDGVKSIARVQALAASGVRVDGVIHLQRNPGDFIKSSMKQEGRPFWRAFSRHSLGWRTFHNRARRMRTNFPYFHLRYENLAEYTDETLRDIFDFLGVSPMNVGDLLARVSDVPWHFMGNASLLHFDGNIRRRQHCISLAEKRIVRLLAGHYPESHPHMPRGRP